MKKEIFLIFLILTLFACNKGNSDVTTSEKPTAVNLIFPFENSECNVGTDSTETESTVIFEWSAGQNTDEYELILTNLNTGDSSMHITANVKISIRLIRSTPYSWYVISKSNSVETTAQSVRWKFYNAGEGITSYAPFPAEIVSPAMSETVTTTANTITLEWIGSDVDNDITGYDVYFGTTDSPEIIENDMQGSTLNGVPVSSNTVYYWKVITKDAFGNKSDSGIYQFKVI
ncbi:MAG: hypothetical protein DRJ10_03345 [Bacteroidetes bacterium]|nr:MAG: hypothetical protein DRJ10_03345 [Bacteroidota bacterium]RLD86425.1 MAG: hypothetical protein DRJ07_00815 [Bacteroidota bacterium]